MKERTGDVKQRFPLHQGIFTAFLLGKGLPITLAYTQAQCSSVTVIQSVAELDATVTMSPGMLAYVEEEGWCIIQNITAYDKGPHK